MERQDIKLILKCPYKEAIEYLLSIVNLTDRQIELLHEVDMKGNTEERTAEFLDVSHRYVQNQRRNAYIKIGKVWEQNSLAKLILKEIRESI